MTNGNILICTTEGATDSSRIVDYLESKGIYAMVGCNEKGIHGVYVQDSISEKKAKEILFT